ncbi:MAG: hypothetical protein JKX70_06580 [Phycisphaerales bacterium]|nr:hypothetical protein [Phycisphaerales bacterium]
MRIFIPLIMVALSIFMTGCASTKNRVIVLGMIHSGHRTSDVYSLDVLRDAIIEIKPDYVLTEIPPDRFNEAMTQFRAEGVITESRVSRFPEYTDVLFPLLNNMNFEIIPCAGWTREMADDRNAKLKQWATDRSEDTAEVDRAQEEAQAIMDAEMDSTDPLAIHTDRYDELVKQALEPYNRLFNDDLGLGGWDNINQAHYDYIAAALDQHAGEAKTILITFGAWHKYWFLEQLRLRDDIEFIDPKVFFSD